MTAFVTSGTKPSTGWRMNGTKYVVLRELEGPVLYLKRVRREECPGDTGTVPVACRELVARFSF